MTLLYLGRWVPLHSRAAFSSVKMQSINTVKICVAKDGVRDSDSDGDGVYDEEEIGNTCMC